MARPRQPLISRPSVVAAAIQIIDEEGLEALSLPRLARHLGVRAPSLYHHFTDKSEILGAVAREIVSKAVVPRKPPTSEWPEWFVQLSLNLRQAALRHRNAAPVLLEFLPRDFMINMYDDAAAYLERSGVPARLHVQILDGMETITLGAIVTEATRPPAARKAIFANVNPDRQPTLARALAANELTAKKLFEEMIRSFLYGVMHFAEDRAVDALAT